MMKIISIANQKGGCGKTITAINLGHAISLSLHKVLFIDLDPQAHATTALGVNNLEANKSSFALFDSFLKNRTLNIRSILQYKSEYLSLIGSNILLNTIEQSMANVRDRATVISNALRSPELSDFEYAVIDTPPNLGIVSVNAIVAANLIVIPLDISFFSMNGVGQISEIIDITQNLRDERPDIRFLITQFDSRSNFAKNFLLRARETFGERQLNTVIRPNVKLREAAYAGKSIFAYMPSSNGAKDYGALTEELFPGLKHESIIAAVSSEYAGNYRRLFKFYAPDAREVHITGTFNDWRCDETSLMKKLDSGVWIKIITLPEGKYYYKFIVDGEWKEDPNNDLIEDNSLGSRNSVLLVNQK